jgi:hypothetical protein
MLRLDFWQRMLSATPGVLLVAIASWGLFALPDIVDVAQACLLTVIGFVVILAACAIVSPQVVVHSDE